KSYDSKASGNFPFLSIEYCVFNYPGGKPPAYEPSQGCSLCVSVQRLTFIVCLCRKALLFPAVSFGERR
ncbi:hypothetical protein, partial [uncultured Alcanivorax sp.]|uniref:hypothetical protein n=1 Tax=uncultured Alcanivorax sp. TaxID=191215 RepID=UPI0026304FC6